MSWFINDVYEPSCIAILKIENADYHWIITGSSKSESIKPLQNIDLAEKSGTLKDPEQFWCNKFTRNPYLITKWKIMN